MNIHYTLKTAIDTGDYTHLKEMLNECQSEQIVLKEESSLIQMAKYFIKLNKKIDLSLFSKKEEMDFNKAFWYSDIKKIQKMMKQYAKYKVFEDIKSGNLEGVQDFVKNTRKVNLLHESLGTPLMLAAKEGQFEIAKFLVEKGAKINAGFFDSWETTPLLNAIDGKNEKVVQLLLESGADILKPLNGYPRLLPLQYTVWVDDEKSFSLILNEFQKRYNKDAKTKKAFWKNNYVLHNAIFCNGNSFMVKELLKAGAPLYDNGALILHKAKPPKNRKEIFDLFFEAVEKEDKAELFNIAVMHDDLELMYHLYTKKCPVYPHHAPYLKLENIIICGVEDEKQKSLERIFSAFSEKEKNDLNWQEIYACAKEFSPKMCGFIEKNIPFDVKKQMGLVKKERNITPIQAKEKGEAVSIDSSWSGSDSSVSQSAVTFVFVHQKPIMPLTQDFKERQKG